ncbi:hypothetical protein HDU76_004227, partial [Blyttiomyces sp. JEL0837]
MLNFLAKGVPQPFIGQTCPRGDLPIRRCDCEELVDIVDVVGEGRIVGSGINVEGGNEGEYCDMFKDAVEVVGEGKPADDDLEGDWDWFVVMMGTVVQQLHDDSLLNDITGVVGGGVVNLGVIADWNCCC